MKRIVLCCLIASGVLSGCGDNAPVLQGYAEGEFVLLAPETSGRIAQMNVAEGAKVQAGTALFRLETSAEQLALDAAKSQAVAAAARFDDATAGGRTPEIAAAREQLEQARAAQVRAKKDRDRAQELFDTGVVPRARLDEAVASADAADARVAEARQRVTLAELPARENQIKALAAAAEEADSRVALAEDTLRRRTVSAPADGKVERVLRYAGDVAGPGVPGIRFLPSGRVVAILFIPEQDLARTPVGTRVGVSCDGCPANVTAEIISIADKTEFTPPIIYSEAERARLVYRARARFTGFTPAPGAPLRAEVRSGS